MKIYAKQISPENQESPLFLGEEFWPEGIILDGNRDYTSRTISAYDDIKRYFDDMAAAWENDGCYYSYEETAEGYRSVRHTCKREYNIAETLREYGFQREDGKAWTTKQRHEWRLLMESGQEADDEKLILAALRLITGKEWNTKTINGCCQGDWQRVFYEVEKWSPEALENFETEYFNTGSEWIVHDEEAEPESPEDINGYSIYCHGWNEDQIRQEIADAEDKKPEEVILFAFKSYARIPIYEAV